MPRPITIEMPPPNETLIREVDRKILRGQMALSAAVSSWLAGMRLSYGRIQQLSALASGRSRLPPATITRMRRAAVDPSEVFRPQAETLVALGDMNQLIADLASGERACPDVLQPILPDLKPLLRLDGGLLDAGDMASVLVGVEGILAPVTVAQWGDLPV